MTTLPHDCRLPANVATMRHVSRLGMLAAAMLLPTACGPAIEASEPMPEHVVMVVIDTLRADAVGCYGATITLAPEGGGSSGSGAATGERSASPTPVLDALAARGTLFESAEATSSWTATSTVSFLSGLMPTEHGTTSKKLAHIPEDVTMLMGALSAEGYRTCGIVCNPIMGPGLGFNDRFDDFVRMKRGGAGPAVDAALELAADRIAANPSQPLFLYIHLFDPHWPYDPAPEEAQRFGTPPSPLSMDQQVAFGQGLMLGNRNSAEKLCAWARDWAFDAYLACVAGTDREMGRLFQGLDELGVMDRALTVVTSDHGEEFGEHGAIGHARQLYYESLRVPLVIAGPRVPRGERIAQPVELRALAPTVLERVGLYGRSSIRGMDLLEPISRDAERDEAHYASVNCGLAPSLADTVRPSSNVHSLRRGSLRLVCASTEEQELVPEDAVVVTLDDAGLPIERRLFSDVTDEDALALLDELREIVGSARTPGRIYDPADVAARKATLEQLGYFGATVELPAASSSDSADEPGRDAATNH